MLHLVIHLRVCSSTTGMSIWQEAGQLDHSKVEKDFTQVMLPRIISRSIGVAILNTELLEARKKWGFYMRVRFGRRLSSQVICCCAQIEQYARRESNWPVSLPGLNVR
jgi:hypothetical protein